MGEVAQSIDTESISSRVAQYWPSVQKVRAFGKSKFLITFTSQEEADKALSPAFNVWADIFEDVRKWSPTKVCQSRRT